MGSSRRLEAETHRNLEVIWLMRQLMPRMGRYLKQSDEADKDDTTLPERVDNPEEKIAAIKERRAQLDQHRAELEASGEDQISPTDPDVLICTVGQNLDPKYKSKIRDNDAIGFVHTKACKVCSLRARCTNTAFRKVTRYANEAILDRMAARLAARPEVMEHCRERVEHPFGSRKQWMRQRSFLTRRIENARGAFSLTALAYNIRRALTLVGVADLMRAISA